MHRRPLTNRLTLQYSMKNWRKQGGGLDEMLKNSQNSGNNKQTFDYFPLVNLFTNNLK